MKDSFEKLYNLNVSCCVDSEENTIHFVIDGNAFDVLRIENIARELDDIINSYMKGVISLD